MTVATQQAAAYLDAQLRAELWARVEKWLSSGESIVLWRHFHDAIVCAYRDFTGQAPPRDIRAQLRKMVANVHTQFPETYLAHGVQNAVNRVFERGITTLNWDEIKVQRSGSHAVQSFLRRQRIRELLSDIRLDPRLIDVLATVEHGVEHVRSLHAPGRTMSRAAADMTAVVSEEAAPAVDPNVQVFTALKRIRPEYDALLRLLIANKEHVTGDDSEDRTPLMTALTQGTVLLDAAVAVIEGKDPELQRLAQREAPYRMLSKTPLQPVPELAIEAGFVDDLRRLKAEAFEQRLHAPDPGDRQRAAGDLRSLLLLLDHLTEPTPFRQKVRLLAANRLLQSLTPEIERIYRGTEHILAQRQAELLVRQRMGLLFDSASAEEQQVLQRRCRGVMMSVEQKLSGDGVDTEVLAGASVAAEPEAAAQEELSDIEVRRGAVLAHVTMRVDGRPQLVPATIMPDPDDSKRFVLVVRDESSRELVPELRKGGRKRFVERRSDGSWHSLTG